MLDPKMERCTASSRAVSGIIERSRVLYHVLFSWSLNQARSLPLLSRSLCHSHRAWHNFAFPQTSLVIFSLLFGFYIYSADLQAKQAHQFMSSPSSSSSSSALAFRRTGICHVCDCNPALSRVLCREKLESSWIAVWMTTATAASSVGVVIATAAATTSPWVVSTRGHTTTKEGGSSVRLSCRATGGSPVCWAGSEEGVYCLGFKLSLEVQIIPLMYIPDHS